jgi:hypothetical protein
MHLRDGTDVVYGWIGDTRFLCHTYINTRPPAPSKRTLTLVHLRNFDNNLLPSNRVLSPRRSGQELPQRVCSCI